MTGGRAPKKVKPQGNAVPERQSTKIFQKLPVQKNAIIAPLKTNGRAYGNQNKAFPNDHVCHRILDCTCTDNVCHHVNDISGMKNTPLTTASPANPIVPRASNHQRIPDRSNHQCITDRSSYQCITNRGENFLGNESDGGADSHLLAIDERCVFATIIV